MSLLEKLKAVGTIKAVSITDSKFFDEKDFVKTDLPILNAAFSGDLNGGLISGLTIFAGESKTYKTLLGLYCMKSYLNKFKDGIALLYDSEFGITPEYLKMQGIDTDRVLHIPISNIEELKFDIVKRLEEIKKNDKVFILIDSIGALPSKKEIDDAIDEKSVADMTRAKAIRSLLRIIGPTLTIKDIPCIAINHIYKTMELYAKNVLSGGTAVIYMANQAFIITRSQEKTGDEITGWNFTINIEKSRFVKEKSKLVFTVNYDEGVDMYSGLLELALESGHVVKPSNGFYSKIDTKTGEIEEKKYRERSTNTPEFWNDILKDQKFLEFVKIKYRLSAIPIK